MMCMSNREFQKLISRLNEIAVSATILREELESISRDALKREKY